MDRQSPRSLSDEIELYLRTYYSLLRSSAQVEVRAFEEAHAFSESSLHAGARDQSIDCAAFAYSAARLPSCMSQVTRVVMGQSNEQFEAAGFDVRSWARVATRGRRRPLRFDGNDTLAAYVTSVSDIDDLVPIVTAYQIEWNKLHERLIRSALGPKIVAKPESAIDPEDLGAALGLELADIGTLGDALGRPMGPELARIAAAPSERSVWLLSGSFLEYQRASQRWWSGIEPRYLGEPSRRRPVYFVSSNTHSFVNLLGGYARAHRDEILAFVREVNPEDLADDVAAAQASGDEAELANLTYYLLRKFMHRGPATRREAVQAFDAAGGITTIPSPGYIDVSAQMVELSRLDPGRFDPRLSVPGVERLAQSDAVILNIDYPLGMAAYHHLSRLGQGVGEIRGVYVMGKAATLNGRVGDVMISTAAYDEHSKNTYLFRNSLSAADVAPWVGSTVLDNQKSLTVRGSFLQNREYMGVFYHEGYTVLEMEAGPYLSSLYEMVYPRRHPTDEIVHLSNVVPFDFGLLHYASDTPYSRRQSLLSKSLSYFGVDATYGCSIAIIRKIFAAEIERLGGG